MFADVFEVLGDKCKRFITEELKVSEEFCCFIDTIDKTNPETLALFHDLIENRKSLKRKRTEPNCENCGHAPCRDGLEITGQESPQIVKTVVMLHVGMGWRLLAR